MRRDGLVFDVTTAGPAGGEPVVLLHGFPQSARCWDAVTPVLAGAGLRTFAPDQRGYSPGARPAGRAAYRMAEVVADAEAVVRLVDERHLARAREARTAFEETVRPGERDAIARHRAEVGEVLAAASALVVAGGHVGVLLHLLRLFAVPAPAVLVAWSAGAMALTERVLLFHDPDPRDPGPRDAAPRDPSHAEFLDGGLGWLRGCVLLPHARRRLRTDDPRRMAELAFRAAPARCVILDDGVRLDLGAGDVLPADARIVRSDGVIGDGVTA